MSTVEPQTELPTEMPPSRERASGALTRAWIAIALTPVFLFLAFAAGEVVISLLGYQSGSSFPTWVSLVSGLAAIAVILLPCVAAVFFGRRARKAGDRRGLIPVILGTVIGLGALIMTIVTEVGDLLR